MSDRKEQAISFDFEAIYRQYYTPIVRFCYRNVGDIEQAKDLAQETFMSMYGVLPALSQQEHVDVRAYLYQSAKNKIISYWRHKALIEWSPLEEHHAAEAQDFTERIERQDIIRRALDGLSPVHRRALIEWIYDRRQKVHAGGFKMAASRAKRKFQENYAREERAAAC